MTSTVPGTLLCWYDTSTIDGNITRNYCTIKTEDWNIDYCGRCEACPPAKGDPDIAGVGVSPISELPLVF